MIETKIIQQTKAFCRQTFKNAEGGHDWFHTLRVYNNAMNISKGENVDLEVGMVIELYIYKRTN